MIDSVLLEAQFDGSVVETAEIVRGQTVTIGRESGNLVFPRDLEMSAEHFRIEVHDSECAVFDLQSTNSTWLNETEVQRARVRDGDTLRAGRTVFKIQIRESVPAPAPEPPREIAEPDQPPEADENGNVWDKFLKEIAPNEEEAPTRDSNNFSSSETTGSPVGTVADRIINNSAPLEMKLSAIQGPDSGKTHLMRLRDSTRLTIGRESPSDFRVSDQKMSNQHCRIELVDNSLVLRDLDSTNGTMLNGQEVTEARISNGDQITIGETLLSVAIIYE